MLPHLRRCLPAMLLVLVLVWLYRVARCGRVKMTPNLGEGLIPNQRYIARGLLHRRKFMPEGGVKWLAGFRGKQPLCRTPHETVERTKRATLPALMPLDYRCCSYRIQNACCFCFPCPPFRANECLLQQVNPFDVAQVPAATFDPLANGRATGTGTAAAAGGGAHANGGGGGGAWGGGGADSAAVLQLGMQFEVRREDPGGCGTV